MKRLYVLVSNKLEPIYGCVQGGHSVAQWLLDHKDTQDWNNEYLIYLYADVKRWITKLRKNNRDFSIFYEPDLGNIPTAIAIEDDGYTFRNLKLVKYKE